MKNSILFLLSISSSVFAQVNASSTQTVKCPAPAMACPAVFRPSVCTYTDANNNVFSEKGSNSCMAMTALRQQLCEKSGLEVIVLNTANLKCNATR